MLLGSSDTSNVDNAIAIPRHLYTCPILNTNANVLILRYFITARAGTIVLDCIALSYICVFTGLPSSSTRWCDNLMKNANKSSLSTTVQLISIPILHVLILPLPVNVMQYYYQCYRSSLAYTNSTAVEANQNLQYRLQIYLSQMLLSKPTCNFGKWWYWQCW